MKSHTHTFAATLNIFFLSYGEGPYICEFEDRFCLDVDVLGLDFLSAVVDRGIDVLRLGALVGTDALDQLVQALLKHAAFSQRRRLVILLLSRVVAASRLADLSANPDKPRYGDISVNLVNIYQFLPRFRDESHITQSIIVLVAMAASVIDELRRIRTAQADEPERVVQLGRDVVSNSGKAAAGDECILSIFDGAHYSRPLDWTILDQVAVAAMITNDDLLAKVLASARLQGADRTGMSR